MLQHTCTREKERGAYIPSTKGVALARGGKDGEYLLMKDR